MKAERLTEPLDGWYVRLTPDEIARITAGLPEQPAHAPSCPRYPRCEVAGARPPYDERECACGAEPERAPRVAL